MRPDAARMIFFFFTGFVACGRGSVTGLDVRVETRDWTAKKVVGDDSFDEKSVHVTIVSKKILDGLKNEPTYVSTIGLSSTVDVLTPS